MFATHSSFVICKILASTKVQLNSISSNSFHVAGFYTLACKYPVLFQFSEKNIVKTNSWNLPEHDCGTNWERNSCMESKLWNQCFIWGRKNLVYRSCFEAKKPSGHNWGNTLLVYIPLTHIRDMSWRDKFVLLESSLTLKFVINWYVLLGTRISPNTLLHVTKTRIQCKNNVIATFLSNHYTSQISYLTLLLSQY